MTIQHLYPTTRPSLDLNFARQKRLDPRVTFTRGSTATYVGSDGLIKTAASNEARFDHDPVTGESLGLLVEEARTNVRTYSTAPDAEFAQDSANFTYTFNQTAPDGTSTAHLITNTSNTSSNRGGQFNTYATIPTSGKIAVSVFVKPVGNQIIYLGGDNGNQGYFGVPITYFDFTVSPPTANKTSINGTASAYNLVVDPLIEDAGNGWYRITNVVDLDSTTTFKNGQTKGPRVCPVTTGTSCYVWGYQIETGSFPTSYIPTTSSTVTRSADVASMTGTNFSSWYNQSEGTWFGEVKKAYPTTQRLLEVGDSATNNYSVSIRPGPTATSFARTASSSSSVNHTYPAKFAVADSVTDIRGCVNGTLANLISTGSSPTDNKLVIGGVMTGNFSTNAIARIAYYPTRLTDAQLQALTL